MSARTSISLQDYKKQRNRVTHLLRKARREYEDLIAKQGKQDPKKIHRYIRLQLKVKPTVASLEAKNGRLTTSDAETAEVLSTQFQSVFVQENLNDVPDLPEVCSEDMALKDIVITESEVRNQLRSLDESKATGPDDIPTIVLKRCAEQLTKPLTLLFKKSLQLGKLPKEWKSAKITPIFKKGKRSKAENYRPISLTSQVCKILERLVLTQIKTHLRDNNLICKQQHGFQKGRSCQTNLLEAMELWTKWLDTGSAVDIVYLDFEKAFDKVPHTRLTIKLKAYGIRGSVLQWIEDFLRDRTQQVVVGSGTSSPAAVLSGVPQGSVLGPTLFVIYINELPQIVRSECRMFADDTKLFNAIGSPEDVSRIQNDLDKLSDWSSKWLIKFNIDKCKTMHCGRSNPRTDFVMNDGNNGKKTLKPTDVEVDLGVVVSSDLKATAHCRAAAKKATRALRLLKMAFNHLTVDNFKPLYSTYVRPHLDYCLQAVGPHMVQDMQLLERTQRRATKLVKGLRALPYPERLLRLQLLSMKDRKLRGDLIETYKIVTEKVDVVASQFFDMQDSSATRGHCLKLKRRTAIHHFRNMTFSNRVVGPWNNLPEHVVSAPLVNAFKKRLDQYWAT